MWKSWPKSMTTSAAVDGIPPLAVSFPTCTAVDPIPKQNNDGKFSAKQNELSAREQRILMLKESVKAKEKEIEMIRLEINAAKTVLNTSSSGVAVFTTTCFTAGNSFISSVSSNTASLQHKYSYQRKKVQQKKKRSYKRDKRNVQTFEDTLLPFIPDPSDQLFRQLFGLEMVVDSLSKSKNESATK